MKRRQVLPRGIPRYHNAETHHAKPKDTTKGTAGYPFTTRTQKAAKISNKNFSFTWVHSLHAELMNASHSTNLFANSCDHVSSNGKAPLHSYINLQHPTIPLFALTKG